jgi:hypothetical protein
MFLLSTPMLLGNSPLGLISRLLNRHDVQQKGPSGRTIAQNRSHVDQVDVERYQKVAVLK